MTDDNEGRMPEKKSLIVIEVQNKSEFTAEQLETVEHIIERTMRAKTRVLYAEYPDDWDIVKPGGPAPKRCPICGKKR